MSEDDKAARRRNDHTKIGVVVGLMMIGAAALTVVIGVTARDHLAAKGMPRERITTLGEAIRFCA